MITLELALAVVAAAIVAAAIRLYDTPKTVLIDAEGAIHWEAVLPSIAGAAIATPIGIWLLGIDVMLPTGFAEAVAIGVAGMAFVRAALGFKEE